MADFPRRHLLIKEAVRKDMKQSGAPIPFWDYCTDRRARINNLVADDLFQLEGHNPHYHTTGGEGDISNLCQYSFYQWCVYLDHAAAFPDPREVLGRCLGPAKGKGNAMSQWILKVNGRVIPRRTVRPLNALEINSEICKEKRRDFDRVIHAKFGSAFEPTRPNPLLTTLFAKVQQRMNGGPPTSIRISILQIS
jgi:hypothetical protein